MTSKRVCVVATLALACSPGGGGGGAGDGTSPRPGADMRSGVDGHGSADAISGRAADARGGSLADFGQPGDRGRADVSVADAASQDGSAVDGPALVDAAAPPGTDASAPPALGDAGPPAPGPDAAAIPPGPLVIDNGSGATIGFDPTRNDAVTALAACMELVLACVRTRGAPEDACVLDAPVCQTEEPWLEMSACCAQACADAYSTRRAAGEEALGAMMNVFTADRACMPGVPVPRAEGGAQP